MIVYRHVTTLGGTQQRWLARIADLEIIETGGQLVLVAANHVGGGISSYAISDPLAPIQMLRTRPYLDSFTYQGTPRITAVQIGEATSVHVGQMGGAAQLGSTLRGENGALAPFERLFAPGMGSELSALGQVTTGQGRFTYSADESGLVLQTHRMAADGGLTRTGQVTLPTPEGSTDAALDQVIDVMVGSQRILVAISGNGSFISTHRMAENGALSGGTVHVAARGTGYDIPSQLAAVQVAGKTFVIMGATGSSSLTVFQMDASGRLTTTDHILDEATTRFQSVTALEAVVMNGRAFVFAGGADDGISVFTLLPTGQLLHLTTIADTDAMTLADVSAIEARVIGNRIVLFVGSSTETGITQLVFEPGAIGATGMAVTGVHRGGAGGDLLVASAGTTRIEGGGGNDILVAGANPVTLVGGTGADIFVPTRIRGRITIEDYEPGIDRLDMTMLGNIRSVWQLRFVPTASGVMILYDETILNIITRDGRSLTAADFSNAIFPMGRYRLPELDPTTIQPPPSTEARWIFGTAGPDRLTGTAGPDQIMGGAGHDTISGGAGNDTLRGETGNDVLRGGDGDDHLYGGPGRDTLFGDAGNDRIWGDDGDDLIYGGAGDDTLYGGAGNDLIYGGPGHDRIFGGPGNDTLSGEDGNDYLEALEGNNRLLGGAGNDTLIAGGGADHLSGGPGNDLLRGGAGNDTLFGDDGNDTIYGEGGNDVIYGGAGNDVLDGGDGDDTIYGQGGHNLIRGGAGNDLIWGEDGNDTLHGDDGNDIIHGGAGNDVITGGAGHDTLRGNQGHDTISGGSGDDFIFGGFGNDVLFGDDGNDRIWGEAGNDLIYGGAGDDRLFGGGGNDTLHGEDGDDRLIALGGNNWLYGGAGRDTLTAGGGNDRLFGGDGDDVLFGNGGNDTLEGGAGNDRLFGGGGDDVIIGGPGRDTMFGGQGNDRLTALLGDNLMYGGHGNDTLRAGSGNDTLFGEQGHDRIWGGGGHDLIRGGPGNDTLHGEMGNDTIDGGPGNDLIWGGQGNDRLLGGPGRDTINGGAGNDTIFGGEGNDLLRGNQGADWLFGGPGDDTLVGGMGPDRLEGGPGRDTFRYLAAHDSRPDNPDRIVDFTRGEDILDLTALNVAYAGSGAFRGPRSVRWEHSGDSTHVLVDLDGDGRADMLIRMDQRLWLSDSDFLL